MRTVTVYRVEALKGPKAGTGPYNAYPEWGDHCEEGVRVDRYEALFGRINSYGNGHPDPYADGLGEVQREEFCGFTSKRALRRWFANGSRRLLLKRGFYGLVAYEVPLDSIRRGAHQCLFVKGAARSRRALDLSTF